MDYIREVVNLFLNKNLHIQYLLININLDNVETTFELNDLDQDAILNIFRIIVNRIKKDYEIIHIKISMTYMDLPGNIQFLSTLNDESLKEINNLKNRDQKKHELHEYKKHVTLFMEKLYPELKIQLIDNVIIFEKD